jgi:hypothetical protein
MACRRALCPAWQKKLPRSTTGHRLLVVKVPLLLLLLGAAAAAWLAGAAVVPFDAAGRCLVAEAGSPAVPST